MHVFWLKACYLWQRFIEFEARVDDEIESKSVDHICLDFENLASCVLIGTCSYQLFDCWNLVGLFKFSSDEKSSSTNKLQFSEGHMLSRKISVNKCDHGEECFWEHLIFVVQFSKPVYQLSSWIFRDDLMWGNIVAKSRECFFLR